MAHFVETLVGKKPTLINLDSIGYVTFDGKKLDVHLVDDVELPVDQLTPEEAKHLYDQIKNARS
jgi:hypothetical protein